jgi:hypothetical protein
MAYDREQRNMVYHRLETDLLALSMVSKPTDTIHGSEGQSILNGMQESSFEYLATESPQIAQVISITQDTTTETFSHQRWECYDVHSEAAARILKSDASQGVGFHPRLVLFVLDLERTIHGEIPPQHVAEARDVRFEAEEFIFDTLGIPRIRIRDAIAFAKHPARLRKGSSQSLHTDAYHILAVSFVLAWTYNHATGSTVVMLSHEGWQEGRLVDAFVQSLIDHASLCASPMILALLAQMCTIPQIEKWLDRHAIGVFKATRLTGYHHNLALERRKDEDYDPAAETAKVSGIAANLASNRQCWEGLLNLAGFIVEELKLRGGCPDGMDPRTWECNLEYIEEHNRCLAIEARTMCQEAISWQQKASIQIQGLFNIIAQREQELGRKLASDSLRLTQASLDLGEVTKQIAEDSKRDSTSMKAIAAVTMCFLPGTFAASLFAMPVFRWNAPSGNDVINHRIWVYWAVTIPLTILTILLYWLWDHVMNKPMSMSARSRTVSATELRTTQSGFQNTSASLTYTSGLIGFETSPKSHFKASQRELTRLEQQNKDRLDQSRTQQSFLTKS